jgi:hypothetical protein
VVEADTDLERLEITPIKSKNVMGHSGSFTPEDAGDRYTLRSSVGQDRKRAFTERTAHTLCDLHEEKKYLVEKFNLVLCARQLRGKRNKALPWLSVFIIRKIMPLTLQMAWKSSEEDAVCGVLTHMRVL